MSRRGKYDNEFKVQALKLKKEVGLEEVATAFFAASHPKLRRMRDSNLS